MTRPRARRSAAGRGRDSSPSAPPGDRRAGSSADAGMVTAELAAAFPAVAVLLALALSAVGAGAAHVRCVDAARTGARALARGDDAAAAVAATRAAAPAGAVVRIERDTRAGIVRVQVTARAPLLGPIARPHLSIPLRADAIAETEPGATTPDGP